MRSRKRQMAKPNEKGCDAMYGKDYVRYKDLRDALNEYSSDEVLMVNEKTGEVKPLDNYVVGEFDPVEKPQHYNSGSVEAITAIEASMAPEAYAGYLKGNIMKYLWRYEKKAKPIEDLKKARWYLDRLISALEKD